MSKVIGIDLGTTNSCVSVVEGGVATIIPNDKGERTTPSVVAFTDSGERLVGTAARRQAAVNANRTVASIKRHMGTDWKKELGGKYYNPQEISAMILRKLREDAEAYLGEKVTDAVITVPAYFNDIQRQATKDAGRIAGLNVRRIINEPTSAALAYGLNNGAAQKIMVYDLGGGTFDVSIIEIGDGVIEVLATCGDNHLGGDDFDERIVQWMCGEFMKTSRADLMKDAAAMVRVKEAAEQAKKELSTSEMANISLPFIMQVNGQPVHLEMMLTRAKFNELTRDLVDRTEGPVRTALSDAGIAASELGRVLLVGGSTRIPAVQQKVQAITGKIPSKNINPDECVAQGAAIQGDTLGSENTSLVNSTGILLLDITPLSLAIETVGGVATRVVERNSTLPVHYSQVFTTAGMFQGSVEIHVLQGERPMAKDNKTIGKFKLKGIRKAMAGVPKIEVTFDIDVNGILTVSARDQDTGANQSITITANEKMSEAEIQQAIRDAEQYAVQDGFRRDLMQTLNEAQMLCNQVTAAMAKAGKQLDKEEKKRVKDDEAALRKLISRAKPDKMTEGDLTNIKAAMEVLRSSSIHVVHLANNMGENQ